jgi:hypothetical protein
VVGYGGLWRALRTRCRWIDRPHVGLGQAIHGANNVPPYPQSKGCARLTVADQTTLLAWLGLDGLTEETWVKSEINLTVNVQGQFIGR